MDGSLSKTCLTKEIAAVLVSRGCGWTWVSRLIICPLGQGICYISAESRDVVRSRCSVTSLVDHDLAEDGAEQPAVAVGGASCLDVQIAGAYWSPAGHVKTATKQRVVEAGHRPADVLIEVILTASGLVVGVQHQLVHVVHVVMIRRRRRCRVSCRTSTIKSSKIDDLERCFASPQYLALDFAT